MATPTLPEHEQSRPDDDERVNERLLILEQRLEREGGEALRTARNFEIFALAALVIALVTLLAVVVKLDARGTQAVGPMMGGARGAVTAASRAPARGVAVSLREFSVTPSSPAGRAGRVTFAVRNAGAVRHEFVVLRTPRPAADLLKGAEADESGHVGEISSIRPGELKRLTLPLKAGHYALICNLPGHYQAGQHADFTVR